jgi:hypothetical protein
MSLAAAVVDAVHNEHNGSENEQVNRRARAVVKQLAVPRPGGSRRRSSGYGSAPGSPAGRTGPPSSSFPISPSYSGSKGKGRAQTEDSAGNSVPPSRMNSQGEPINPGQSGSDNEGDAEDPYRKNFVRTRSGLYVTWYLLAV